jgi:hypothetical protein
MAGPFKLTDQGASPQNVGKMPEGPNQNITAAPTPLQLVEEARSRGMTVQRVITERRVQDGENEIPWPAATDPSVHPMRLTQR